MIVQRSLAPLLIIARLVPKTSHITLHWLVINTSNQPDSYRSMYQLPFPGHSPQHHFSRVGIQRNVIAEYFDCRGVLDTVETANLRLLQLLSRGRRYRR